MFVKYHGISSGVVKRYCARMKMLPFQRTLVLLLYLISCVSGCTNYANQDTATVSTYNDLIDAIDCDVVNITISGAISVTGEVVITEKSINFFGLDDTSSLEATSTRIFNLYRSKVSIETLFLNGGVSNANGGCVLVVDSHFTSRHSSFIKCQAVSGGALYASNSSVSLHDTKFISNEASDRGGGYFCDHNAVADVIDGVLARYNLARIGAGFAYSSSTAIITNSTLEYNTAGTSGGCIYSTASILQMTEITLDSCAAGATAVGRSFGTDGGCIHAVSISQITLGKSVLTNCSAMEGGLVHVSTSLFVATESTFDNSTSVSASMYVGFGSQFFCTDCTVTRNRVKFVSSVMSCVSGSRCEWSSSEIHHNTASYSATIYIESQSFGTFNNCQFHHNTAGNHGGVVYLNYLSNAHFTLCDFYDNSAVQHGGAIYLEGRSNATVTASNFDSNEAGSGGAISTDFYAVVSLTSCVFTGNKAYESGGAIYLDGFSAMDITGATFSLGEAVYGAGVYVGSSTVTLANVNAVDNDATYAGGFLAGYNNAVIDLMNSTLRKNSATYGGALYSQLFTNITLSNVTLENNLAVYTGGAIAIQDGTTLLVDRSDIASNRAIFSGGGITSMFSVVELNQVHVVENDCIVDEGGGLYALSSKVNLVDCNMEYNEGVYGGAVYCGTNSTCASSQTLFYANKATYGGGIFVDQSEFVASKEVFDRNLALQGGGAVYSPNFYFISFSKSNFTMNVARNGAAMMLISGRLATLLDNYYFRNEAIVYGGAVSIGDANSKFDNCNFVSNVANNGGGALMLSTSLKINGDARTDTEIDITGCNFVGNIAVGNGGAILASTLPFLKVINCTFAQNNGKFGGAYASFHTEALLEKSLFVNNSAVFGGGGIYWENIANASMVTVDDSCENIGNNAAYGSFKATNINRLVAQPQSTNITYENSGHPITNPIYVNLVDLYGQVVVDDGISNDDRVVYSNTKDSISSIQGSTIVEPELGVAYFKDITVTYQPLSEVVIVFYMSSSVEAAEYVMKFRDCIVGEVEVSSVGGTVRCEECEPGSYSLKLHSNDCLPCDKNARCGGGNEIDVDKGYWRVNQESDSILICPVKQACEGGNDTAKQCRTGHKGAYCTVCEDGYSKSSTGLCHSCSDEGNQVLLIIIPVIIVFVVVLFLVLFLYRERIKKYLSDKIVEIAEKAEEYNFSAVKTKFKIIIAFVQIINQFPHVFDVVFPESYMNFLSGLWIFNLDFLSIINLDCLYKQNFYDKLVQSTLMPIFVIGVIGFFMLARVLIANRLNANNPSYTFERSKSHFIFAVLIITFIIFSPVSITIFQTFSCEHFDDGSYLLVADYSVDCEGEEYQFYKIYAALMVLVYPFGIPSLYLLLLRLNRDKVNPRTYLVVREDERHLVSQRVIQEEKIKLRDTYEDLKYIAFLYETYEPQRWYFEILDCGRRLFLTAIPVLIMRGTVVQIVLVMVVSLACVAAYMELKPYVTRSDNLVAVVTQWVITLTLIVTIMFQVSAEEEDETGKTVLAIILIFINSGVLVMTICLIVMDEDDPIGDIVEKVKKEKSRDGGISSETQRKRLSAYVAQAEEVHVVNPIKDDPDSTKTESSRKGQRRKSIKDEKPKRQKPTGEDESKSYTIQRSGEADSDDDDEDDTPVTGSSKLRASSVEEMTIHMPVHSAFAVDSTSEKPSRRRSAHEESLAAAQTKFKGSYKNDDTFQHVSPMHEL